MLRNPLVEKGFEVVENDIRTGVYKLKRKVGDVIEWVTIKAEKGEVLYMKSTYTGSNYYVASYNSFSMPIDLVPDIAYLVIHLAETQRPHEYILAERD